jgi:L-cystine uptake protein TcyP (sodium:dicarboxylate symporter family)
MKQTSHILVGLAAGLAIGLLISATKNPALVKIVSAIEPAGTAWASLFEMTVIPLVVSLLITSITATTIVDHHAGAPGPALSTMAAKAADAGRDFVGSAGGKR